MPKKLKTYQTSIGFFDLALAAPSMKAALEAWGSESNLFHQGAAVETDDGAIVAATMAKPGVVLKRPVGSTGAFGEHAALPKFSTNETSRTVTPIKSKTSARMPINDATARKAAVHFDMEKKRREVERRRDEAANAKENERRQRAVAKALSNLEDFRRKHEDRAKALETERAAIDEQLDAGEKRWMTQRRKLEEAYRTSKK